MNRLILIATLLLAVPAFAQDYGYPGDDDNSYGQPPAPGGQGPTIDDFAGDGSLQMNGQWVDTPEYGQVWQPTSVDASWQPYEFGRWVWTDAGWAWVSDEPFGWAVYHYGRWGYSDDFGWFWIPGRVWAPAWVAWRTYGDYSGWCPLGPQGVVYERQQRWVWVDHQHFLEPVQAHRMQPYAVPRANAPAVTGPRAGPPIAVVQRATGREVRPLVVRESAGPRTGQSGGGSVYFYRPRTAPVAQQQPQARPIQRPYFGGVPGPAYGGVQRPAAPQPAQPPTARPQQQGQPHATQPHVSPPPPKPNSEQPHAKER